MNKSKTSKTFDPAYACEICDKKEATRSVETSQGEEFVCEDCFQEFVDEAEYYRDMKFDK